MSALDDILNDLQDESATDDFSTDWDGIKAEAKQCVKDLMLELIGENEAGSSRYSAERHRNDLRAELRQRVNKL